MLIVHLAPVSICFLLFFLLARLAAQRGQIERDWRLYWVLATIGIGFFCVLIAEVAGAFHSFGRPTVQAAWLLLDAAIAAFIFWKFRPGLANLRCRQSLIDGMARFYTHPLAARLLWGAGIAFGALLGGISSRMPTVEWDSSMYHVPRIMHWLQDRTLAHFAAPHLPHVCYPPGGEILSANLCLLSNSDALVNLPAWFAGLSCGLLASFVAQTLITLHTEGTGRPWPLAQVQLASALAFVLVLTCPMAAKEAVTAKNDSLLAFWNLCMVALLILYLRQPGNWFYASGGGLALALGACTKVTAFFSTAPFVAGGLAWLFWRRRYAAAVRLVCLMLATGSMLNAPWMLRNYRAFHSPFGPAWFAAFHRNADRSANGCVASIIRNLSLYTAMPSAKVTQALNSLLCMLTCCTGHRLQDKNATIKAFRLQDPTPNVSSNAWFFIGWGHFQGWFVLATVPCVLFLLPWRGPLALYSAAICVGFCLFSFAMKWNPDGRRYDMPYHVMALPLVALCLAAVAHRLLACAMALLVLGNGMYIVIHFTLWLVTFQPYLGPTPPERAGLAGHELVPSLSVLDGPSREQQIFCLCDYLYRPYVELAEDIVRRGCTNVLVAVGKVAGAPWPQWWEYQFRICLKNRGFDGAIHHFLVHNESGPLCPCRIDPKTAMVFIDRPPPAAGYVCIAGREQPLLRIGYLSRTSALFPAAFPGNWMRLVRPENQTTMLYSVPSVSGVDPNKPILLSLSCKPVDSQGRPFSNGIFHVQIGNYGGDRVCPQGIWSASAEVPQGAMVPITISLLSSSAPTNGPINLSDLAVALRPVKQ